mmetsp:Transcript_164542/g.400010  ORF Transcript_164542/g.400010 Transcript_164542/m.400010 type:complete len:159 (+) Transcript_164542:2-478(+)
MPEALAKTTLETMEKIQKEMIQTSKTAIAASQFGATVSAADKQEIKDREEEVAELITKLKEKAAGKGVAAIKDVAKTSTTLAKQVTELGLKVKNITVPTALAIPQRKMGVGECIVHAAGVLQDGLMVPNIQKAPEMFSKVYAAKAHGAWQLHRTLNAI